jgi:hypothetical protein
MSTNQFVLHCAIDIALQCQIYVASAKTKGRASSDRRIFPNERLDLLIDLKPRVTPAAEPKCPPFVQQDALRLSFKPQSSDAN